MKSRIAIYIPTDTHESTAVSFSSIAGVPLFLRQVLELYNAGETVFTFIAPSSHRRHLLKLWGRITKNRAIHLNLVLTKDGHRLSAEEINELKNYLEPSAYLLNANYIVPSLATSLNNKIGQNEVHILRPTTKRNAIIGFSSQLLNDVKPGRVDECINQLLETKNKHYFNSGDDGIIVQKFSEIKIAEKILAEHIRKNTQTFVAREINKRISLPISLILTKLRISPNTITVCNIFIGLCAGIGAAGVTYKGVLLGALLFQIASIIDGCDGEVAKLTYRTSKFGQYIDSISDNLSLAAFLTGMMIHQYRITHSIHAFVVGGAIIVGTLSLLAIMSEYLKKYTNSASFVTYDKQFLQKLSPDKVPTIVLLLIKYFKLLFKKDLFSLMFLVFAVFGILHWWFYIMALGIWVAVGVLFYLRETQYP
jgi:phosphatidylglycerophosphate synthase